MTDRRGLLAGLTGASFSLAGAARAAPPKADDGAQLSACPRCGQVHAAASPLKPADKP